MDNIVLFLKGIIIGIGKIIPGVSGSVLAISLGVYEKGIAAISRFFEDKRENFKLLLLLGSGILLSIVIISKLISSLLINYYLITMLFFIGLILGSLSILKEKLDGNYTKNNIIVFTITFLFMMLFLLLPDSNGNNINIFSYFIIGVIDAATMIIPGISGTAVLMVFGLYDAMLSLFSNLSNFSLIISNIKFLFLYGLGLVIGGIIFVKIIDYLFRNYRTQTYFGIVALTISSVILMFAKTLENDYYLIEILFAIFMLVIGYKISKKLVKNT